MGDLGPTIARQPLRNRRKRDLGSAPTGSISGVQVTGWACGCLVWCGPWLWPCMVCDGDGALVWVHSGLQVA